MQYYLFSLTIILILSIFSSLKADDNFEAKRYKMVKTQIIRRGISDPLVIKAMESVPRHEFVQPNTLAYAYDDGPLYIGEGQTISQPYIVAIMTELLNLEGGEKVLEIGTGSGYQAAVLAEIAKEVYTIEIVEYHAERAEKILKSLGYKNVFVKHGDGYYGWPEHAPFDGIIITAAPPELPQLLVDQLKENGRIVVPIGDFFQELKVYIKQNGKLIEKDIIPVSFVPMTGKIDEVQK